MTDPNPKPLWLVMGVALLSVLSIARIVSTYRVFCETADEAIHIAAGYELLARHSYELDFEHPPLARAAFAVYALVTAPRIPTDGDAVVQGHQVLFWNGVAHYTSNLSGARAGNLPFFLLAVIVVAVWARRLYGDAAGILAALIVTFMPPLLGHAGLATTDMAAAATPVAALYSLTRWLDARNWWWALTTGIAIGVGLLSKFSFVAFFGAGAVVLLMIRMRPSSEGAAGLRRGWRVALTQFAVAIGIVFLMIWSGYALSTGRGDTVTAQLLTFDPSASAAFNYDRVPGYEWVRRDQVADYWNYARVAAATGRNVDFVDWARAAGFPSPLAGRHGDSMAGAPPVTRGVLDRVLEPFRAVGHRLLRHSLPAPQFIAGMFVVAAHNRVGHESFLLGRYGDRGWWYYFPVVFFFKTPLPFLVLCVVGSFAVRGREAAAMVLIPLAIFAIAMGSSINIGLRHILPAYPFLSIVAAAGVLALWRRQRTVAAALMAWYLVGSAVSHPDYMAYFNELAGSHPERITVDSNLDWGQDAPPAGRDAEAAHSADPPRVFRQRLSSILRPSGQCPAGEAGQWLLRRERDEACSN